MQKEILFGRMTGAVRFWSTLLVASVVALSASPLLASSANADSSLPPVFYLAIGGSESLGVQPTATVPRGERTDNGYANVIVEDESEVGVSLDLHEIGCSGETTTTMLYGGDTCYSPPDSQLNEALTFLRSHHDEAGLVTVDLGFNNVKVCLSQPSRFETCLNQQTTVVASELASIMSALKLAAGPNVNFVGLNHDDPYLANSLIGGHASRLANTSVAMVNQLNKTLRGVYSSFDVPVADVAAAFSLDVSNSARLHKSGSTSQRSFDLCELTWMCALAPYGPNIHPNDAGYLAIAGAIEAVLPPFSL